MMRDLVKPIPGPPRASVQDELLFASLPVDIQAAVRRVFGLAREDVAKQAEMIAALRRRVRRLERQLARAQP